MKRTLFSVCLLILISTVKAQVKFDALEITPQLPKAGQTVNFKFDSKLSSLIDEKKIDIVVYLFGKKGVVVSEPKISQTGTVYSGSLKIDTNTACIAFGFSSNEGKLKDNNAGRGYVVPVYGSNNQPVIKYYYWAGVIQNGYGYLFDISNDSEKALALLEEGLKKNPEAINDNSYLHFYMTNINSAKKKDAQPVLVKLLEDIESKPGITDADYGSLVYWYSRLKMKSTSDSLAAIRKEKFPDGAWKKEEMENAIRSGKDAEAKKAAYESYIKAYPPKENDQQTVNFYKTIVANAYFKEKNYEVFKNWANSLPVKDKASLYNNASWDMALAKDNLPEAKLISYEATSWAKREMTSPTEKKPESMTKKQWNQQRRFQYAMYGDTYSLILYELKDYKNGFQYAKESAEINEFKNAEYNERYCDLMVKVTPPALAKKELEKLTREGVLSSKSKELLKDLYVAEKKSDEGYAEYLAKLEMAAKEKRKEELAKTMINEVAPKFNLKDLDGNEVSLASLNGKVVVVDFWATWCGPCIASMPAMKVAQEKLMKRDDVKFVFVDTWESVENKKENAADFMKNKDYPFHVLLDTDDKVVADYKVSGIPTKFIIDKKGNIRFKSIGFGGNDDALIDEVSMMVDMASADIPVDRHVK